MAEDNRAHHPPPVLFGVTGIPYGICGGFVATTMPFFARKAGISVEDIGWYGTALFFPPIVQFLYAPIVDIEPARAARRPAKEVFVTLWRDVARVARSRQGWTGMLFMLSPVGTAALINYFAALAPDYHASNWMVSFVNGAMNGVLTGAGSLIGDYICDRANRRAMYLLSAALTALAGMGMALAPMAPMTYAVGVSVYFLVAGFCYAAFSATVLETIGKGGAAASTQYALFVSAGNTAIAYVGWIDTRFHHNHGARGLLVTDAALNIAGIVALSPLFTAFGAWKGQVAAAEDKAA